MVMLPIAQALRAPVEYGFPVDSERLLPWSFAEKRLVESRNYWLATTRADGRPHVTPLWAVWVDNVLYFDGLPTAQWARNIARNPAASVNLENGSDVVILEGLVDDLLTDEATAARIIAAWDAKYGRLHPEPATRAMFRFRPHVARGWSADSLTDGTRWRFPQQDGS
jgi:nitroimidazol reductase NimA-like FMN-containing flavoprotein (pyridoxamine 5'-phosphate oxidase superfamily)